MSYVTSDRAGRVAVKTLFLTVGRVCAECWWDVSVRYGVTCAASSPCSAKVAAWRLEDVLRTITAIDPSLLRNALTSSPVELVVAPMRTAPGRMKRL
jgi:hypothetical protein